MNGYSSLQVFTDHDKKCAGADHMVVMNLPDKVGDQWVRCHEVARIVAVMLDMGPSVIDGHYGIVEHSWIVLPSGTILDPYAVGRMPIVQLVHTGFPCSVHAEAYRAGQTRDDIDGDLVRAWVDTFQKKGVPAMFINAPHREREIGHW